MAIRQQCTALMMLFMAAAVLTGCGPSVVLDPPSDLPAEWNGRKLFNTPHGYIYASDSAAAGEADRIVAGASKFIVSKGGTASKGVVIVTASRDAPLTDNATVFRCLIGASGPWTVHRTDLGYSPEEAWGRGEFSIPPTALPHMLQSDKISADRIPWAVAIPTEFCSDEAGFRLFARLAGPPGLQAFYAWPLVLALAPGTQGTILYQRDMLIFREMARCSGNWTQDLRQQHAREFEDEPMRRLGLAGLRVYWP